MFLYIFAYIACFIANLFLFRWIITPAFSSVLAGSETAAIEGGINVLFYSWLIVPFILTFFAVRLYKRKVIS